MPVIVTTLDVEFDDDRLVTVSTDQRDLAGWEVQPFHDDDRPHLRARFLAWHAMKRQGTYEHPFDRFNRTDCVEVRNAAVDDQGDGERLDPGKRATSAGRSST